MKAIVRSLQVFVRFDGAIPFEDWIDSIRDPRCVERIFARVSRLRLGNPGDHRSVGRGVFELRLHFGPGFRVYVGTLDGRSVVLLIGGDKGTQDEDIVKAWGYWEEFKKFGRSDEYPV
jgi:putative addiction module killer protein